MEEARPGRSELSEERDEVGLLLDVELQLEDQTEELDGILEGRSTPHARPSAAVLKPVSAATIHPPANA